MIDLNDAGPQIRPGAATPGHTQIDFKEIVDRLQRDLSWVEHLFPRGRKSSDRKFWCMADWSGREPTGEGSCRINLTGDRAGHGYDFSTNQGYDPIGAIGRATGLSGLPLYHEAARISGMGFAPAPPARQATRLRDVALEVAHVLGGTAPLTGTVGEHYLSVRGLSDPQSPDLLFHPDLSDFDTRRGYCGLVAIVRDARGQKTGGIHRTFLVDDGSSKALPGKKMLGSVKGGSVRLAPVGIDGHLGIAEGIETALAVTAIFNVPCWAGLTAGGVASWEWPQEARRVTIFADAGKAGQESAATLIARLTEAGICADIRSPLHGDDFNDDLKREATASDYPSLARAVTITQPTVSSREDLEEFAGRITKPADGLMLGQMLSMLVRAQLEPVAEQQMLALIKRNSGLPISALRDQVKLLKRRFNLTGDTGKDPEAPKWFGQLRRDFLGQPERNESSVITAMSHDPAFAGVIVFDEFRQEILVTKALPWDGDEPLPRPWRDTDDIRCAEWMQRNDINVAPTVVGRSIQAIAREYTIHPVRQYLEALEWDGKPRLETWPMTYLGADGTPLNAAFGSRWMISAVARVMQPGVKVDHVLILEGPQEARKSTALRTLTGGAWFTDQLAEIGSKDAAQQLRGVWIIEMAEMDAIGKAEVSRIKAFITSTVDRYRPAYGRYVVDVPRQCVFAGSVNPDTYLRDETGNRRFWPIRVGDIDIAALARDRDQLWAEAYARYVDGAIWWLEDRELIAAAKVAQDERYQGDAWDERIDQWLEYDLSIGPNTLRHEPIEDISIGEILLGALSLEPAKWTRSDQMRVSAYLKRTGWERYNSRDNGLRAWRYRRRRG